jgi:hypothetical protein
MLSKFVKKPPMTVGNKRDRGKTTSQEPSRVNSRGVQASLEESLAIENDELSRKRKILLMAERKI